MHGKLCTPLLSESSPVGVINVLRFRAEPFTERQIALVEAFADQAVIAIENARLFEELERRNRELTEALERQTATAEILKVIASSPTDAQPVLDAIVQSAKRLSESASVLLNIREGEFRRVAAVAADRSIRPRYTVGDRAPLDLRAPGTRALREG